jgi:hypothetical protein
MRKIAIVAVTAALALSAQAAFGVARTDPDDVVGGVDIARSKIRVVRIEPGVFRMRLVAQAYEELRIAQGKGSIYWQLDANGDGVHDYEAYIFTDMDAIPPVPATCLFKALREGWKRDVKVSFSGTTAVCAFPRRFVKATEPIRWRLAGRMGGVVDRAPDSGWYPG